MEARNPSRTIGSVETACEILDIIEASGEIGVSELAEEIGLSKGTTHSYLASLVESGYAVCDEGRYRLSLRYLGLSESVTNQIDIYDLVVEQLDSLASEFDERAQFCMEEQGRIVFVYRASARKAVNALVEIGGTEPMHCVSGGKAILAHLPRDEVAAILDRHGLEGFTENTITEPDALFDVLDRIRKQGYALHDEERIAGIRCIALPLFDDQGDVVGSISVCGPASRMPDTRLTGELLDGLEKAANVIEVNSTLS